MKKLLLIFFLLPFFTVAQNLVPNPSFEQFDTCPNNNAQISFAGNWYAAVENPDYYNACDISNAVSVPKNFGGFQYARTGIAYAGFSPYNYPVQNFREYLGEELSDTLKVGKKYCVEFYLNLADSARYAVTEIGMYFSKSIIDTNCNFCPLPYTPQVISPAGVFLNDTAQWMLVSGTYIAQGGEKYITIGNFNNDTNTSTQIVDSTHNPIFNHRSYYYIDDISVIDCDSITGLIEADINYGIKIFPNPASSSIRINSPDETIKWIKIYDVFGSSIKEVNYKNTIDVSDLARGIYLCKFEINKKVFIEKIILTN